MIRRPEEPLRDGREGGERKRERGGEEGEDEGEGGEGVTGGQFVLLLILIR